MTTKATEPVAGTDAKAASPEALLKAAVSGARDAHRAAKARALRGRLDLRLLGVGGGALALGLICGAGLTAASLPGTERAGEALAEVRSGIEAGRTETARLGAEIERLGRTLAAVKETGEAARSEAAGRSAGVIDRVAKLEQTLGARLVGLGERVEHAEREQGSRFAALATQIEKRPAPVMAAAAAAPVAAPPAPAPVAAERRPEPVQTGSLAERLGDKAGDKAKPAVVEGWALRDIYNGAAILEDRRRRIVEVGVGDAVPGVGRVEAVERRGRDWVVVTRLGVITAQPW